MRSSFECTPFAPILLHLPDLRASLRWLDQLSAFCLSITFLNMIVQCFSFLITPAFRCILCLEGATQNVFDGGVSTTGKPFIDERFEIWGYV